MFFLYTETHNQIIIVLSILMLLFGVVAIHLRLRSRLSLASVVSFILLVASPITGHYVAETYVTFAYPIDLSQPGNTAWAFNVVGIQGNIIDAVISISLLVFSVLFFFTARTILHKNR